MINRRNFFTITLVMLILALLFQLTGASKLVLSNYEKNEYEDDDIVPEVTEKYLVSSDVTQDYISFFGRDSDLISMIREYCYLQRKSLYIASDSIEDIIPKKVHNKADLACIQGSMLKETDLPFLQKMIDMGYRIVFLDMPDVSFVKANPAFQNMLGIIKVQQDQVSLNGVFLNNGFLLGGEQYYEILDENESGKYQQDLTLNIPWYVVGAGCTHFFDGILDSKTNKKLQPGFSPAIIWNYHIGESVIYTVLGDYMKDITGVGIMSAFEATSKKFVIYPVVNAESLVFENYPTFAYENSEKLRELYERDAMSVQRDLIWSGLASIVDKTNFLPSYTMAPYIRDESASIMDDEVLVSYMQLIREQHGEVGFAFGNHDLTYLDTVYLKERLPDYGLQIASLKNNPINDATSIKNASGLTELNTVIADKEQTPHIIGSLSGDLVYLSTVSNASDHKFSDDIRERSILTAMGYLVIKEDFSDVIYPESSEDEWQNKFDRFASNVETYYKDADYFDKLTLSKAGIRARNFLNCRYSVVNVSKKITLSTNCKAGQTQYYLFRAMGKKIYKITGATYKEVEEDVYLIRVNDQKVVIEIDDR
ncbi:MAG: hypothetical protein K6F00_06765 [Lachnospiraceae bacterium]|nr:hypothetical protein [Lachnospiraceae bacterium]